MKADEHNNEVTDEHYIYFNTMKHNNEVTDEHNNEVIDEHYIYFNTMNITMNTIFISTQ